MGLALSGRRGHVMFFLYYEASQKTSTVMLIQAQIKSSQAKRGISVTKCHQTFSLHTKPKKSLKTILIN